MSPHPVESYALTRNQSEGSILKNRDQVGDDVVGAVGTEAAAAAVPCENQQLPSSYQQKEGNRAYTEVAKSADNLFKSSDLGYASDICDYNVVSEKKKQHQQQRHSGSQLVSPLSLKPSSPLLESSLYDRRMRLIRKRASVFASPPKEDNANPGDKSTDAAVPIPVPDCNYDNNHSQQAVNMSVDSPPDRLTDADANPTALTSSPSRPLVVLRPPLNLVRSDLQTSTKHSAPSATEDRHLVVPKLVRQQSSTEDEGGSSSRRKSNGKSTPASSGVKAKIARRKMMRAANSLDKPQGSLSDQDANTEDDDEEEEEEEDHSVEEKQDSEPINEKSLGIMRNKSSPNRQPQPVPVEQQLTPETARKNWNSRFANIKNSFEDASEDDKSRSPSINRTSSSGLEVRFVEEPPSVKVRHDSEEQTRGRARGRTGPGADRAGPANMRSRSAHNIKMNSVAPTVVIQHHERAQSKEDKNKLNTIAAAHRGGGGGREVVPAASTSGYGSSSDNKRPDMAGVGEHSSSSGRDSVDYHQYLEMIQRFRGNNPKVYDRPLQKNVPTVPNSKATVRENPLRVATNLQAPGGAQPPIQLQQRLSKSQPRENDPRERAEVMGFVRAESHRSLHPAQQQHHHHAAPHGGAGDHSNKNHDMDYQEYMNIINKVRKTKEFTRVRTEQIRLASMYAQEKKRQEEIKLEEERLKKEREKIEREREEAERERPTAVVRMEATRPKLTDSNRNSFQDYEKGQLDNDESEQTKISPNRSPMRALPATSSVPDRRTNNNGPSTSSSTIGDQQAAALEKARLEQIRREQLEQKRQQELRELQVKAEQEKLEKLREDQLRQEKEREEINRLELERLQQIQEEQRRLEDERRRQEESIRLEQARLEEERRRQEKLRSEKNALYNRQRLDMEAQNQRAARMAEAAAAAAAAASSSATGDEDVMTRDRLVQQDKLREEHKKEEAQIRKEKLNLLQQEEMLIRRQEEMLRQIEAERINLTKQEDLIRSRQQDRLLHVRQEKQLLEKQEEMLMMREQQLMQERARQDKLRDEQRALKEQEEAIKKRQEEISKELMMAAAAGNSDLSDTGSESITMCQPREGQVFKGPQHVFPDAAAPSQQQQPPIQGGDINEGSDSEETLDEEEEEDYYETKVEVQQKPTSVPTSVRTIETRIDNPAWAPITPYLSYQQQNPDEVSAIFAGHGRGVKPPPGVVTSPESVTRTSTSLITTPESSLHSQLSMSSSCPGSPPPIPPLPMDQPGDEQTTFGDSFQPVQPDVPPRDVSFAAAAAAAYSNDIKGFNTSRPNERRSLIEDGETLKVTSKHDKNKLSPRIGGPGSAFKPYASSENLYDPSLFAPPSNNAAPKSPVAEVPPTSGRPLQHSHSLRSTNGRGGGARQQAIYSKVRELRKPLLPPFSNTDTEPEMRECNLPTHLLQDPKRRLPGQGKSKAAATYSTTTSETEEEYQAYLRSRHHKWHGKNGTGPGKSTDSTSSWDPLLVESPPQIVQKPVGIIQKPKAAYQATTAVERGTQVVNQTPIYAPVVPSPLAAATNNNAGQPRQQEDPRPQQRTSLAPPPQTERIQKSDSIIEVRTNSLLPESVTEISRRSLNVEEVTPEPEGDRTNNSVGAPPPLAPAPMQAPSSEQVKTLQEKYLANVQANNPTKQQNTSQFAPPAVKVEAPPVATTKPQSAVKSLHDKVMGEAVKKVEEIKALAAPVAAGGKKKVFSMQRTNPTIAAMEIMTRKENAQNAMEERMLRDSLAAKGQQQVRVGAPQGKQQNNTFTTSSMNLTRPISSPVASKPGAHQKPVTVDLKQQPVVSQPGKLNKASPHQVAKAAEVQKQQVITRASQERLREQRQQKEKEEEELRRREQEEAIRQMEVRQMQLEAERAKQQEQERLRQRQEEAEKAQRLREMEERKRRQEQEDLERQRQQQEQRRHEELRLQQLEQRRQEELRLQQQEKRRQEDLRQQQQEQRRQEELRMQQERELQQRRQQEALRQQQQQQQKLQQQRAQQQQQPHRAVNSAMSHHQQEQQHQKPLVKPHPSMARSRSEQKMTPEPPVTNQQPVIILKKQPKILAPEEIRARKNSTDRTKAAVQDKAKKAAETASNSVPNETDPMTMKNDAVRKAAERFEKAATMEEHQSRQESFGLQQRSRSKSIGHNLSQRLVELDYERERTEGTKSQMTSNMPWSTKPPALRRRDNNLRNYELRMSKSSDSITAAKMLAEARMRQQQQQPQQRGPAAVFGRGGGGGLRINQDMSRSMEKQIDVYTKTREDIRRILQASHAA